MKNLYKALLSLVILQFIAIFFINFTKTRQMLGFDSSLAIRHTVEMWKNGLFLKDFNYFSTLEIDNVAFFAAPIYILTGKLNVSIAIVHIIFYLIIVYIIYDLFKNVQGKNINFLIAILILFTPFSYGELDWANLIYVMVGQYEFRIIVLLLMMDTIILSASDDYKKNKFILLVCVTAMFTFWTSLSCGNYVLLMEIFPLIIYVFFDAIIAEKRRIFTTQNFAILCFVIVSILGWKLHNNFAGESFRNSLNYISAKDLFSNIFNEITGIFLLFGAVTYSDNLAVLSLSGIKIAIHLLFVLLCVYFIIINVRMKQVQKSKLFWMFASISGVNLAVLALTNTQYGSPIFEYRYHIVWCVSMILFISEMFDFAEQKWITKLINIVFLVTIILINVSNFEKLYKQSGCEKRDNEILSVADQYDIDTIYLYDMPTDAHVIRSINTNVYCVSATINDNNVNIDVGDFYYDYADNAVGSGKNLLVIKEKHFQKLPEYIKEAYTQEDIVIGKYNVYVSEKNPWDGKSGLPGKDSKKSIDYPYSAGFTSTGGVIQENGTLAIKNAEEGYVFCGPYTATRKGTYNIKIYYDSVNTPENTFFDVCVNDGENELAKEKINEYGVTEMKNIEFSDGQIFAVRLWMPENAEIKIVKIEYERVER